MEELLEALGGSPTRGAPPETIVRPTARRRRGMGVGGCLVRLVMLVFFLVMLLVSALFFFSGTLIQIFGPY